MFKGLLIMIIAGTVSSFGFLKVYKMTKRCHLLKDLSSAFSYIHDYINLYRVSQWEVFEKISKMPCYKELDIFSLIKRDNKGYLTGLEKSNLKNYLTDEDFLCMNTFFEENSMYDLEMYLKSCNNLSDEYHNLYKKANDEKNEKEKLFTSLSVLGGLFIIVVLI